MTTYSVMFKNYDDLNEDIFWMEQNLVILLFQINTQTKATKLWNWTYKEHCISVVHLFWLLCWLVQKELPVIHKNGWHCQTKCVKVSYLQSYSTFIGNFNENLSPLLNILPCCFIWSILKFVLTSLL